MTEQPPARKPPQQPPWPQAQQAPTQPPSESLPYTDAVDNWGPRPQGRVTPPPNMGNRPIGSSEGSNNRPSGAPNGPVRPTQRPPGAPSSPQGPPPWAQHNQQQRPNGPSGGNYQNGPQLRPGAPLGPGGAPAGPNPSWGTQERRLPPRQVNHPQTAPSNWQQQPYSPSGQFGGAQTIPGQLPNGGFNYERGREVVLADPVKRLLARLIDGALAGLVVVLLTFLLGGVLTGLLSSGGTIEPDSPVIVLIGLVPTLLGFLTYLSYFVFTTARNGQTVGKKIMKIKVVSLNGEDIGFKGALARFFAEIICSVAAVFNYLWCLWDPKKQTLYDKVVSTQVVMVDQ